VPESLVCLIGRSSGPMQRIVADCKFIVRQFIIASETVRQFDSY
jgi:hypothetical protein